MYYQSLKENKHILASANPKDFLIDFNGSVNISKKNAMFSKGQPTTATLEAGVQKWFNELEWHKMDIQYSTFSYDTHAKPLANGRKPDASLMGTGCAKSITNVAIVCDLKRTTLESNSTSGSADFSSVDKGKALDLAQSTLKEQKHLRSAGVPCYLCDGVHIQFFLYSEQQDKIPRVVESPVMLLVGAGGTRDGGVWLLSLLSTPLRALGIVLPDVYIAGEQLPIHGLLGIGGTSRVMKSTYDGGKVAIKWRTCEKIDWNGTDTEYSIQKTLQDVTGLRVPRVLARSDCGELFFLVVHYFYCRYCAIDRFCFSPL